jgi:hypothetical protein
MHNLHAFIPHGLTTLSLLGLLLGVAFVPIAFLATLFAVVHFLIAN